MATFQVLTSTVIALPRNDIDTDQIIPARFLKVTTKEGLEHHLFADWRYHQDGTPRADFVLADPRAKGAQILVAGDNFGCGSSREHAPWALHAWGFRAILAPSFADIFRGNALKNGLLPIVVAPAEHQNILAMHARDVSTALTIDLRDQSVTLADGARFHFDVDGFSRHCLLHGVDELGYLLAHDQEITAHEAAYD